MARPATRPSRPVVGLALGSGMARGWAHIGVLRALEAAGITPGVIAGTSMGAVIGGVALAGRLDAFEEWARRLTTFGVIRQFDVSLSGGGLVAGERTMSLLRRILGNTTFADLPAPFACVATDLFSGHEVWLRDGRLVPAMRASFSLPGVLRPFRLDGRWLIDGAMVNPVPVSVCRALGAQVVIAVNVNADVLGRDRGPVQEPATGRLAKALEDLIATDNGRARSLLHQVFARGEGGDNLTMFGVMAASLGIVQDRITRSRLAGDPPDVTVTPRVGHMGLMDFQRAAEIIALGREAAEAALPRIRDLLGA